MTISPLIISAENLYDVQGQLARLGYNSVFDVVGISRERFVRQHRDTLGRNAGQVYDLLIGYALQVDRQFRHRPAAAVNMAPQAPSPKPGPDYPSQFNKTAGTIKRLAARWKRTTVLLHIWHISVARSWREKVRWTKSGIELPLAKRRPDLVGLMVDDAALSIKRYRRYNWSTRCLRRRSRRHRLDRPGCGQSTVGVRPAIRTRFRICMRTSRCLWWNRP